MPHSPISKSTPPFSVALSFSKNMSIPGQDQQNGKRTWYHLTLLSFKIDLKEILFHIPKFFMLRILKNVLASQKIESRHFYLCQPSQNSPVSHHHFLGRRKLLILPRQLFSKICFPNEQNEGDYDFLWFSKFDQKIRWLVTGFFYFIWSVIFSNVITSTFNVAW